MKIISLRFIIIHIKPISQCECRDLDPGHELGKLACCQATPHSLKLTNTTGYIYFDMAH